MARLHRPRRIQASHRPTRERVRLRSRDSSFHPGPPVLRRLFEWDPVAVVSLLFHVCEILGLGMGGVPHRQREVRGRDRASPPPKGSAVDHDYHLLLLPRLIRDRVPEARVGFFLHIPFPPYDVFRLLPWHREILQGMLGADLIGFHTYDYARAFLGSVLRDLGLDNRIGTIVTGHRAVQVDVFPLGVDVAKFNSTSIGPSAGRSIARLRKGLEPSKLLFS